VPTTKSIHGDETPPAMASPVVNENGTSKGHSNGDKTNAHVDKLTVLGPVYPPNAFNVPKSRNGIHVNGSSEVTENTVSRSETHTEASSLSQSRITNFTDSSIVKVSSDRHVLILRETVTTTRNRFIRGLEHVNDHYIDYMTIDSFLEYIESERLAHMPHRGSRWDKVLKWAEFYAVQIAGYQKAVSSFVQESKGAAQLIWVACRLLLEVSFSIFQFFTHIS
jgi:hypothetical protein